MSAIGRMRTWSTPEALVVQPAQYSSRDEAARWSERMTAEVAGSKTLSYPFTNLFVAFW